MASPWLPWRKERNGKGEWEVQPHHSQSNHGILEDGHYEDSLSWQVPRSEPILLFRENSLVIVLLSLALPSDKSSLSRSPWLQWNGSMPSLGRTQLSLIFCWCPVSWFSQWVLCKWRHRSAPRPAWSGFTPWLRASHSFFQPNQKANMQPYWFSMAHTCKVYTEKETQMVTSQIFILTGEIHMVLTAWIAVGQHWVQISAATCNV